MAPLSREVGEGLPKVREFWWDLSLGRERGRRCRINRACGAKPHQGKLRTELNHNLRTPENDKLQGVYDATPL